jgi:TonB-linked SusC/RagA family outer membrane protein
MTKLFYFFGNRKRFLHFFLFSLVWGCNIALALAQENVILQGKVIDERNNESIIGASVRVKSAKSNSGAISDVNGDFKLNISSFPATLVVSYLGYRTEDIEIYEKPSGVFTIFLIEKSNALNEVVVTGYSTHQKKDYTGSASLVGADRLEDRPAQSFDQLLGGAATGVDILATSGELNTPAVIRIRGINSISSGIYPLIVVDGVPVFTNNVGGLIAQNPLSSINPNDIESVTVLKDAAASAIYGSRAANGVLVITTKQGAKGKPQITFESSLSYVTPYNQPKILNSTQYIEIKNEGLQHLYPNGTAAKFDNHDANGNIIDTNWQDVAYRDALQNTNNLSIAGSNDYTNYYLSVNYANQNGIIRHNNFENKIIHAKIEQKLIKDYLKAGANFNYNNGINQGHTVSGNLSGGLNTPAINRQTYTLPPNVPVYNPDGSYNIDLSNKTANIGHSPNDNLGAKNEITSMNSHNLQTQLDLDRVSSEVNNNIGNVFLEWNIIKGLQVKTNYALNRLSADNSIFYNPVSGGAASIGGRAIQSNTVYNKTDWTNTLNYDLTLAEKHNINALFGHEYIHSQTHGWGAIRDGLIDPSYNTYYGGYTSFSNNGVTADENVFLSYFTSLNYDYNKKYFLSYSFRRDGYSGLPKDNIWGNFNAVSAGWNIATEDFFKQLVSPDIINELKLNASYGEVGNINIGSFPAFAYYASTSYAGTSGLKFNQAANNDLQWETSKKTNIGATIGFLNDRYSLSFDYYKNNVDGLIVNVPTAPSLGLPGNTVAANVGSLYNKGVELGINATIVNTRKFSWNSALNFSTLENKVSSLSNDIYTPSTFGIMNLTREGYAVGSIFAVPTLGVDPENGRRIFLNSEGREVEYDHSSSKNKWTYRDTGNEAPAIDNYKDGTIQGTSLPTYFGGWNNTFKYKNFDLGLNFTFSGGNKMYNATKATLSDGRYFNNGTFILDRWQKPGDVTDIPKVVWNDNVTNGFTISNSYYVEDGDYLKLKNIVFGYTFKLKKVTNQNLSSLRLFVQATNLFTVTKYGGIDPELSNYGNSIEGGFDRNSIVNSRTFTAGLKLTF